MRTRAGAVTAVAVTAVAALVLAACTPDPSGMDASELVLPRSGGEGGASGPRVEVVLPPSDEIHAAVLQAMERDFGVVQAMSRPHGSEIRAHVPDDEVFVQDLVAHLGGGGAELTCALTTGATGAVREAHRRAPQQRFCALVTTALDGEEPDNLDIVVLRTAELGHLVGVAAAVTSTSGTVALALSSHDLERGRFLEGLRAGAATVELVEPDPEGEPVEEVIALVEDGADVVVVGSGPLAVEIGEAAIDAGAWVLAPTPITAELDPSGVAVGWRILWNRALRPSVDRMLERDPVAPLSIGLAEGVFVLAFGDGAGTGLNPTLVRVTNEIVDGTRDPFATGEAGTGSG